MGRYRLHRTRAGAAVTRRRAGDPLKRGRILGLEGHFVLSPDLTAPGAIAPTVAAERVIAQLEVQVGEGHITGGILITYKTSIRSLARYCEARGVTVLSTITVNEVIDWLNAPTASGQPTRNEQVVRRAAARVFFTVAARIGLWDQNPALPIQIPGKYTRYTSPFTDTQIDILKNGAVFRHGETQAPAIVALLLSGVTSGECGSVRICDIDLTARTITTPVQASRFVRQRVLPIADQWCSVALRNRVTALTDAGANADGWLVYQGESPEWQRRNAACSNLVTKVLRLTRLYEQGISRIASITEWVAVNAYQQTGDLKYVANLLGMRSLDAAAHLVGHEWTVETVPPLPPTRGKRNSHGRGSR